MAGAVAASQLPSLNLNRRGLGFNVTGVSFRTDIYPKVSFSSLEAFGVSGDASVCRFRRENVVSRCESRSTAVVEKTGSGKKKNEEQQLSCVMKFGGSSVASADRMLEVADLVLSFHDERPVIVLSAMGKTTNKLLQVND